MNKSKEQASVRRPETIELWVQLTGKKLFWWEPLGDSGSFVVCDSEETEYIVRQNNGDIEFRQISFTLYLVKSAPLRDDLDD